MDNRLLKFFGERRGDVPLDQSAHSTQSSTRPEPVRSALRPTPLIADFDAIVAAPFGAVGVAVDGDQVVSLAFLPLGTPPRRASSPLAERASEQIRAYLADPDAEFDLPLAPTGSTFQRRVWEQIAAIPSGQTLRYGDIARALDSAARAVGQACGDNRYPLVIPCHRVVAAADTGGFAHASRGFSTGVKQWLLQHEQRRHEQRQLEQRQHEQRQHEQP